ncbi:MAG TPA: putative toxin-antitoxin system toxin component, PIN family [Thermodesulfovibrionales bacterium]|nr:putative toxin-antitoxin system toxin component, PIN family [Thermodesulfovibrionales bacterium]
MRVVLDTNIFISALIFPGGKAEEAVMRIIEGEHALVISHEIIDEVLTVLARKFSKDAEALSRAAVNLATLGELVRPVERLNILDDKADNRLLECAVAGNAAVIVTGDKAMLMLRKYRDIRILSLSEFLRKGKG